MSVEYLLMAFSHCILPSAVLSWPSCHFSVRASEGFCSSNVKTISWTVWQQLPQKDASQSRQQLTAHATHLQGNLTLDISSHRREHMNDVDWRRGEPPPHTVSRHTGAFLLCWHKSQKKVKKLLFFRIVAIWHTVLHGAKNLSSKLILHLNAAIQTTNKWHRSGFERSARKKALEIQIKKWNKV